ncbi:MAG TPA: hypothetical protein EYP30_07445 [Archaeoglobaceae archaeon]|nr:hypothetical protein [Archaeoglobaceae archaeon]
MVELLAFGIAFLFSILSTGFFLWAGLRLIGKKRGIFEAGLANFAAGIFAFIIIGISVSIPSIAIFFPITGYVAYLYALKALLGISFLDAFIASILASGVFILVALVLAVIAGIWLFNFTPVQQPLPMHQVHF